MSAKIINFNSDAGGMAVARPHGFKIDFVRNPIPWSAAWFFVIILKFIFTPFLKSKFMKKNFLTPKKFHFRSPVYEYEVIYYYPVFERISFESSKQENVNSKSSFLSMRQNFLSFFHVSISLVENLLSILLFWNLS